MQMRLLVLSIIFLARVSTIHAQLPYTVPMYTVWKDSAVAIGTDINYCGRNYDLKMNIYKPVGDGNLQRPMAIFVHGGAFTSGEDFNEYNMNEMAKEFAKRGYVAASINYREGHHLYPYGIGSPAPINLGILADWTVSARLFVADSAEVLRSIYRAQQDTKAAIRKMKERNLTDSSSLCKVFIAGHSAGAITSIAAAFMDLPSEKSPLCGTTTTLINPNWTSGGFDLFGTWVITQVNGPQDRDDNAYQVHNPFPYNYDAAACYSRPDLGPIDGTVNNNGVLNTKIMGIASLAGAVVDTNIFIGSAKPAIFMYQIANDLVVPFNYGRPFNYLSDLLSPAPNSNWPVFYGSYWMQQKLLSINYPAAFHLQVFDNGGNLTNSHDILPSISVVADSVAQFFAKVMDTSTACLNIVLPISTSFTAIKQTRSTLLKWKSYNAGDIYSFIIERSVDGINYSAIGELVNPTGLLFSFIDMLPAPGINYYRLKEKMKSGYEDYSETRVINFNQTNVFIVYPNPSKDIISIDIAPALTAESGVIRLLDMQGKLVLEKNIVINITGSTEVLHLGALVAGQYTLQLLSGRNFSNQRVILIK
ncbi:hypothetical protein BH11BAC4_BH11BAC4_14880 [soil metagenome]